jgi:hypothetical protein
MKKIVFILVALVATAAQAQLMVQPKAGVVLANVAFSEKEDGQTANFSYVFGVGVNIPILEDNKLSIQPELLYMPKGFRYKVEETNEIGGDGEEFPGGLATYKLDAKSYMNYIELPVLAKATFGSDNLKFFVNAGPYVGFWLSGKTVSKQSISFNGDTETETETNKYEFDDTDNRLDYGFHAGGGVAYRLGPGFLTLEGRYEYGLANFLKDPDGQTPKADLKSQHRLIMIMVGYAIKLGQE